MEISVLATTKEYPENQYRDELVALETFAGKNAGICYMKDSYYNSYVSDNIKAYNRFYKIIPTGHHSVADHPHITLLFENIPKITAMVLNSLGMYTTSEKSGRYTDMAASGKNKELYDKWYDKFYRLIIQVYPNIDKQPDGTEDDNLRKKLAKENARYMLSVFEPSTTMSYTVSLRQLSYIVDWCQKYIETARELTDFDKKTKECIRNLHDGLVKLDCYSKEIHDNKGRGFDFLAYQTGCPITGAEPFIGDSYVLRYKESFVALAQEQRHRTIDYFMLYDGNDFEFYIPDILKNIGDDIVNEWLYDLGTIKETYPLATRVEVIEIGLISNFMLKCDERLCGRVQLETMKNCANNLLKFEKTLHKTHFMKYELEKHYKDGEVLMKCHNVRCKEPCIWGPVKALDRLI